MDLEIAGILASEGNSKNYTQTGLNDQFRNILLKMGAEFKKANPAKSKLNSSHD